MKILHLEDNPNDALLVSEVIRSEWAGVHVDVASNRAEFLAALDMPDYEVVVSDFHLPDIDGREVLGLVRARRPELPVIFVSGTIGEDKAAEIMRAGAADYLLKDRLKRLPMAIRHALQDLEGRRVRRLAEQRVHEQAELLDKVHDGILVTSLSSRVMYWNRAAERIFGWPAAEALGRNLWELLGHSAPAAIDAMERQLAATGEWRGELALNNKDRRPLLAEVRVTLVKDTAGNPRSRLSLITDITERKHLEEQLLRAQRLESLGMLAAGIAHDLNNALAPSLMAVGLLRGRITDPGDLRLVELLEQSAQRGAALVKQIVSFAGARTRERVIVQPKHLLHDLVRLAEDTFPKAIRIEHEIPTELWSVRGDPTQLHQVLLNLCINARDAMKHGGTLKLRAMNRVVTNEVAVQHHGALPGRHVVIEVIDTGSGIAPEVLAHIWDPFFTTKEEGKGTGLGLSTVRGIVANHGGFLAVSSQLGHGATFAVYLPAAETDGAATVSPATPARPSFGRGQGELVLVVDDQASVRESICAVLNKHGYRSLATADGIEALSKYAERVREVSLVITDLDMPGLNGIAFSHAILRLNPTLKVLFISGTNDVAEPGRAGAPAGAEFLPKPFAPEDLLARVEALVHGHDA